MLFLIVCQHHYAKPKLPSPTKIKSLFVVKWKQSDMIGWVDVNKLSGKPDFRVTMKGTNRLNDSNEIEVCRYIPVLDFNVIRTWK